jgi:adenosylhomocysteine nucleosidase
MWQSLLRNWLMSTARDHLREAAAGGAPSGEDARQTSQNAREPRAAEHTRPPNDKTTCHVAVVFALSIEAGGLIDRLSGVVRIDGAGFVIREGGLNGRRIVVVESGAGREAAARATASVILGHDPRWVVAAGFAGGLDDRLARGDVIMADEIMDASGPSLAIDFKLKGNAFQSAGNVHVGRLLTSDRVIESAQEKRTLGQSHGALAVDMESMGVAQVCSREKRRFLSIRVISDAVDRTLPRDIDYLVKKKSTAGRLGAAAGAILRRPASIKDMWQLKEDALMASERLANFLVGAIGQLP